MSQRDHKFFPQLTGFANAIDNLKQADPLNAELFAKDDDYRKARAAAKRLRRQQRNLKEKQSCE